MGYATDKFLCKQVPSVLCSGMYKGADFVGSVHVKIVVQYIPNIVML